MLFNVGDRVKVVSNPYRPIKYPVSEGEVVDIINTGYCIMYSVKVKGMIFQVLPNELELATYKRDSTTLRVLESVHQALIYTALILLWLCVMQSLEGHVSGFMHILLSVVPVSLISYLGCKKVCKTIKKGDRVAG